MPACHAGSPLSRCGLWGADRTPACCLRAAAGWSLALPAAPLRGWRSARGAGQAAWRGHRGGAQPGVLPAPQGPSAAGACVTGRAQAAGRPSGAQHTILSHRGLAPLYPAAPLPVHHRPSASRTVCAALSAAVRAPRAARQRREFFQCDFDVAGVYPSMVADAEVVKVLSEILTVSPPPLNRQGDGWRAAANQHACERSCTGRLPLPQLGAWPLSWLAFRAFGWSKVCGWPVSMLAGPQAGRV